MLVGLRRNSFLWWGIAPALTTILVIWYQYGFSLGGMLEEWDQLWLIQKYPLAWTSFPGQAWSELFAARPLQALPIIVAHKISDDSFLGFHLVLMGACFVRIIGGASIGYFLFRNRAYAAALGILFWVFPADTQQFEFRTIHISLAVGLMAFSSSCALRAILAATSRRRWIALTVSITLSVVAVLIYEPVFTLYAIAPLALFAHYGIYRLRSILKIRWRIAVAWLIGPMANAAYLYYAIVIFKSKYQVNASHGSITKSVIGNLHYLIDSAAYRILFDAWVSAWTILLDKTSHYTYITVVGLVIVIALAFLSNGKRGNKNYARFARYIAVGLLALIAGYIPYMVADTHVVITQRTFMAVAPGGSIIIVTIIFALCRRSNFFGSLVVSGVILLSFVSQLYQFDIYTRDYVSIVRPYTSLIADETDPTKRVHLIFDTSGFGGHLNGMYKTKIQYAPEVRRRENNGEFVLCMSGPQSQYILFANCTLKDSTWTVRNFDGTTTEYPESVVQAITVGQDFNPLYRSHSGSWRDHGSFSISGSLFEIDDPHAYRCEADSMWGYSRFCRGEGWSDGIFNHDKFRHVNFFTAISQNASLIFRLSPSGDRYLLRAKIFGRISSDLLSHMKISVNGMGVDIKMIGHVLQAQVPTSFLKEGQNKIEFLNVVSAGSPTGLALSRVDLAPEDSPSLIDRNDDITPLTLDEWQEFSEEDANSMLQYGFSQKEKSGVWTDGRSAQMVFLLPKNTGSVTFVGEAIPFFDESHTHLNVAVSVDGARVWDKTFSAPAKVESFKIPIEVRSDAPNLPVVLTFTFDEPAKPSSLDQRDLSLFFTRFKITK